MQVTVQQVITGDFVVRWWEADGRHEETCSTLEGVGKVLKMLYTEEDDEDQA